MLNKMRLEENEYGTYDILICYSTSEDSEFGLEFLSAQHLKKDITNIFEYVKKQASKAKLHCVKILINGIVITTMSLSSFMNVYGAGSSRYSMAYLNSGNTTQQISYINRTNGALNTISPSYFNLNANGTLNISNINTELISHAHSQGIKVIPFLSNHWDRALGESALNNAEALSTEVANYISEYNLDGVNVDIENVNETQRDNYTAFVQKLRSKIPILKEVSVAVAANPNGWLTGWHGSYDYTNLANNSDYLMMMTYDEHWNGGEAGPVASISFVENSIKYALTKTTANKIVMGIPFFGRIWSSNNEFKGAGITLDRVSSMVATYKGIVTYDTTYKSVKAVFTVKSTDPVTTLNGKTLTPSTYTIWYENEASIQAKMALVTKYNLKGIGAWALGQEPSTIWANYSNWLNQIPVSSPTPVVSRRGKVNTAALNIRSSPNTSSKIIGLLKRNVTIDILASENGWHTIKLATGQTGYISR